MQELIENLVLKEPSGKRVTIQQYNFIEFESVIESENKVFSAIKLSYGELRQELAMIYWENVLNALQ